MDPYRSAQELPHLSPIERARVAIVRVLRAARSPRLMSAMLVLLAAVLGWRYLQSSDVAEFCYVQRSGDGVALWGSIRGAPDREIARMSKVYEATAVAERLGCEVRP